VRTTSTITRMAPVLGIIRRAAVRLRRGRFRTFSEGEEHDRSEIALGGGARVGFTGTNTITAQVTSTTMMGTDTSLVTFACTSNIPGFQPSPSPSPSPVPQAFRATKQ